MFRSLPLRVLQLIVGLSLYGVGIGLMVRGALGISPWDVLAQGIATTSGLEFGLVMFFVSLGIFLLWIPLRQRPGVGTALNIVVVPITAQLTIEVLEQPEALWLRIVLLVAGLWVIGVATGIYLGAGFGPGPRDGLMTGLHRLTGWPIWLVRTLIEVVVVAVGWLLGGDASIGTLAFALLIGPIVHLSMPWFAARPAKGETAGPAGPGEPGEPGPESPDDPDDGPPAPTGIPG